jgi:hypothetical protein
MLGLCGSPLKNGVSLPLEFVGTAAVGAGSADKIETGNCAEARSDWTTSAARAHSGTRARNSPPRRAVPRGKRRWLSRRAGGRLELARI